MFFERASRSSLSALVVSLVLTSASIARAASPADKAAARDHLKQAEELRKKGRVAEACQHLEEVERLYPQLPTLIELAECSEQAGDVVAAQAHWAAARDRAKHDEKPQSRAKAEGRLAAMQKRVAHVTLQLANAPAGVQVSNDNVALDASALGGSLPMNPGDHVIVVKLAGHDDAKFPIKLADGDNQTVALAVGPVSSGQAAAPPPPAAAAPTPPPPPPPLLGSAPNAATEPAKQDAAPNAPAGWWSTEHKAGVILGIVGVAAIGGGSTLCVLASKKKSDATSQLALGGVSIAGGGVLFLSGLVLLAAKDDSQHGSFRVAPTLALARDVTVLGAAGEF